MKLTAEERHKLIENYAYRFYEIRKDRGEPPDDKLDWFLGERAVVNEERMEKV